MKKIAILGAAGRLGDAAAKAFVNAGWQVRAIGKQNRLDSYPLGVEGVVADLYDGDALIKACEGCDVILNAGNPTYDQWEGNVLRLGKNALEAAKVNGATLLLPGNVYNYGRGVCLNMSEDQKEIASNDKSRIRIALEALSREYALNFNTQTIVLRGGDFFGGVKSGSWLDLMILRNLKKGKIKWPGPLDVAHAFAYLPDFANAFVSLAEQRANLEVFTRLNFSGHTLNGYELQKAIEAELDRSLKLERLNWRMFKILGFFIPLIRAVVEMSYLWELPHSLDNRRLETVLGDMHSTDVQGALAKAIKDQALA